MATSSKDVKVSISAIIVSEVPLDRELVVFDGGDVIGTTTIHPTVAALMRQHGIDLGINNQASWPRWEAWSLVVGGFHGDPNQAVLECCWKIRKAKTRPPLRFRVPHLVYP